MAAEAKRKKPAIPVKRITGELQVEETKEVLKCRIFLNDLTAAGVSIFLEKQLAVGTEVSIALETDRHLYLKAEVEWCNLFNLHNTVVSKEYYPYRAGLTFRWENQAQADEFLRYRNELFQRLDPGQ